MPRTLLLLRISPLYADQLTDDIVICGGESSGDGKRYSTESVVCCRVAVETAAGDADVVQVAGSAAESAVRSRGVSELREVEGAGGLGAVSDGAVARLLAHTHLVGLALQVLSGRGARHVAVPDVIIVMSMSMIKYLDNHDNPHMLHSLLTPVSHMAHPSGAAQTESHSIWLARMFHLAEAEAAARFTWTAPATLRSPQHKSADLEAGGGGGRFAEVDVHVVP